MQEAPLWLAEANSYYKVWGSKYFYWCVDFNYLQDFDCIFHITLKTCSYSLNIVELNSTPRNYIQYLLSHLVNLSCDLVILAFCLFLYRANCSNWTEVYNGTFWNIFKALLMRECWLCWIEVRPCFWAAFLLSNSWSASVSRYCYQSLGFFMYVCSTNTW